MGNFRIDAHMIWRNAKNAQEEQTKIEIKGLVAGDSTLGYSTEQSVSFGDVKMLFDMCNGARLITLYVSTHVAVRLFPPQLAIDALNFGVHESKTGRLTGTARCKDLVVLKSVPLSLQIPRLVGSSMAKSKVQMFDVANKLQVVTIDFRASENDFVAQRV